MKEKINLSLAITIATILLSVGGSWAVMKNKVDDIDKLKVKTDATSDKVIAIETKIDNIKEGMQEQKEDVKAILKILVERRK